MFSYKEMVIQETLGEYLQKVRRSQGVDLGDVERETGIRYEYLDAIEKGAYDQIPGDVYVKHFIRSYARALRVSPNRMVKRYQGEAHVRAVVKEQEKILVNIYKESLINKLSCPRVLQAVSGVFVGLVILGYISWAVYTLFAPPELIVTEPSADIRTADQIVVVRGQTHKEARAFINDEAVVVRSDGTFSEEVPLKMGMNLLIIESMKEHGRPRKIERHVLVVEPGVVAGVIPILSSL